MYLNPLAKVAYFYTLKIELYANEMLSRMDHHCYKYNSKAKSTNRIEAYPYP